MNIKKISDYEWQIPKTGAMKVPVTIYASEKLLKKMQEDKTLEQIKNVSLLPGIVKHAVCLPDAHQGYGFPIGGVAAFNLDTGIVSPGGVGYDINCGVRLLSTNIKVKDFKPKLKEFLHDLKRTIPSGVGYGHKDKDKKLSDKELDEILKNGAEWAIKNGYGTKEDLKNCEENGKVSPSNPDDVSQRAKARGKPQLGTLGAGNHFLEIQKVESIFDDKKAEEFGIAEDTITIMIHCGSRGLGHQVASDYIKLMEQNSNISRLPDRELVNAPIKSELGKKYMSAMNCAVNFAFCNRQMIMHYIIGVLKKYFPKSKNELVYDVCHNVAKFETHLIDGEKQELCIHRKGATRAFNNQPVLLPGSMGTSSYVLVGTKIAEEKSFASTAHGAGRVMSRSQAIRTLDPEKIKQDLKTQGIEIETGSQKGISEEAPQAYKDIDEVAKVSNELGIGKIIARLKPLGVMKG